jgi:hypothetical protein
MPAQIVTAAVAVGANTRAQPDHLGDEFLPRQVRKIVVHRHHQRRAALSNSVKRSRHACICPVRPIIIKEARKAEVLVTRYRPARPGGNVTGVVFITDELGTKRLELLRQFIPKARTIAVLVNPNTSETEAERKEIQVASQRESACNTAA